MSTRLQILKEAKRRWPDHVLARAYGAAGIHGSGTMGCRVVPARQRPKTAIRLLPGRGSVVDEFYTSRVSSANTNRIEALPEELFEHCT